MIERGNNHIWISVGFLAAAVALGGAVYVGTKLGSEQQAPQPVASSSNAAVAVPSAALSAAPGWASAHVASLPINRANLIGRWISVARGCDGDKLELQRESYQGETIWNAYRIETGVTDDRGDSGEWRIDNDRLILSLHQFVEGDVSDRPEAGPTIETITIRNLARTGFEEVLDHTGSDGIDHQIWRRLRTGECESPPSETG